MSLVKMAEYLGWDCIAIFEEDCIFSEHFNLEYLKKCLDNIPLDCDSLVLGTNKHHILKSEYFSPVAMIDNIWGSHAYILFKRAYEKYQKVFSKTHYHADQVLNGLNTYAIYPEMFKQKLYDDRIHK